MGGTMKKLVLLLVVTAFVGSPAAADTKEKKANVVADAVEAAFPMSAIFYALMIVEPGYFEK
jgi:hypothetical protein